MSILTRARPGLANTFLVIGLFSFFGCGPSPSSNGGDDGGGLSDVSQYVDAGDAGGGEIDASEITDSDRDGLPDDQDNCPDKPNSAQRDLDEDGIGDACDDDIDGDDVKNSMDNCREVANPDQDDNDEDGDGDACDDDDDDDGVLDEDDNCPFVANEEQGDIDEDGFGDVCDPDADGDGYEPPQDCDDENPDISPMTPEVCNGEDDNCDELVDFPRDSYSEPENDSYETPHNLGSVSDTGGWKTVSGANLSPQYDVDWYIYHDSDDSLGLIYPEAEFTGNPGEYTVCLLIQCDNGSIADISCEHGNKVTDLSADEAPPVARSGCCSQGRVKVDHSCGGTNDDSANVYVKVYSENNTTCDNYSLKVGDE